MVEKRPEQSEKKVKISNHDFYFETPVYDVVKNSDLEETLKEDVDAYSAENHSDTTYSVEFYDIDVWWSGSIKCGFSFVKLTCKRKNNDKLRFILFKNKEFVMKVGQYPSIADLQFAEIGKKYDKVLSEEDLKNLKKAIGLVAHGAGAGSFVYLRRIFENLILETFKNNIGTIGVSENDFIRKRMEDKIVDLKPFLPSQLIEMKSIYGILSRGVHELSEEECLTYFAPLKLSIELILDQKIESKKKSDREAEVKKQLQAITKELNK